MDHFCQGFLSVSCYQQKALCHVQLHLQKPVNLFSFPIICIWHLTKIFGKRVMIFLSGHKHVQMFYCLFISVFSLLRSIYVKTKRSKQELKSAKVKTKKSKQELKSSKVKTKRSKQELKSSKVKLKDINRSLKSSKVKTKRSILTPV
jgi:high-affinity K+ transport system ATPase subunit B